MDNDYPRIMVAPSRQVRVDYRHCCYLLNDPVHNPEAKCGRRDKSTNYLLHTWMTYQIDLASRDRKGRELTGPRGGRATRQFARYVYYDSDSKRFFGLLSNKNRDRKGPMFKYGVIDGPIWSCFPSFQERKGIPDCTIYLKDGYPVSVVVDDEVFAVDKDTWRTMESFLGFDEHWSRRYGRVA